MAKREKHRSALQSILIGLIAVLIAATGLMIWLCINIVNNPPAPKPHAPAVIETVPETTPIRSETTEETEAEETTQPEAPTIVATANILSTGDLLMHGQLITDARQEDGSYDFHYIFPYLTEYVSAADFAVANLETTLAGTAKPYSGNPMFNCPDDLVDAAKDAGFDMLLTANNHSYDSQQDGFLRTVRTVREKGLLNLGTMESGDEPKYTVQDIGGIHIGMLCYTYEDSQNASTPPALNYNPMKADGYDLVNCFRPADAEPFYETIEQQIAQMKEEGAEAIVLFIHWGIEYKLEPVAQQKEMAQRLCDLGVDVIVGGHPHVVEPMALLTSTADPEHKTVCLYSMGNAVSNQRQGKLTSITSAHTEDGVLLTLNFVKYSDGSVYLDEAGLIPTWVRAVDRSGNTVVRDSATIAQYQILPLEDSDRDNWQEKFGINDSTLTQLTESWQRTMDIVSEGLTQVNEYLTAERIAREAA